MLIEVPEEEGVINHYCVRHGNIVSVFRVFMKNKGLYTERWDPGDKKWVDYPALMRENFIGSEIPYEEASEEEVMEFIKVHS